MKILYFDCFSGVSGNMILGAMVDAGIDIKALKKELKKLDLHGYSLKVSEAEAKIHSTSVDNVHFHEVGAVDSIVDVVGASICISLLNSDITLSSPINTGKGMVKTEHGLLPVPAPATTEMLKGFPSYSSDIEFELATPTGVGIITAMAKASNTIPVMKTNAIGYGAGSKDFSDSPNLLRIMIGEGYSPSEQDSITVK